MIKKIPLFAVLLILTTVFILKTSKFLSKDIKIEGNVKNAYSKQWVYGAKITIENKVLLRYATTSFCIDRLKKGKNTIKITAPNYETQSFQVYLKNGINIINDIMLKPLRIPDLSKIYVFVHSLKDHYELSIRLVNSNNYTISHAPHLPLFTICKLFKQEGGKEDKKIGEMVYRGNPSVVWDYDFEEVFPLKAKIPYNDIKQNKTKKYVLYTELILPDENLSLDENDSLFIHLSKIKNEESSHNFLIEHKLKYLSDITRDIEPFHRGD